MAIASIRMCGFSVGESKVRHHIRRGLCRILLYANTIRHLKVSQIWHRVTRQLRPQCPLPPPRETPPRKSRFRFDGGIPAQNVDATGGRLKFLNQSKPLTEGQIDWQSAEMPKLWRYNLHYFDWLQQETCPEDLADQLVGNWIENNPIAVGDGWEAYPTSLRIVNWIKFFARIDRIPGEWLQSLIQQAYWIERNTERDILANHYLKNAKALVFAGSYFSGSDPGRWLATGCEILGTEIPEQILPDGGHFERSAMYHAIVLEDLLDVLNLARANPNVLPPGLCDILRGAVRRALAYLQDIQYPDGEIPLFNDAALGVAPAPQSLLHYGLKVADVDQAKSDQTHRVIRYPDTGYFGHRSGDDMLLMDCGPIGPDYQPGHGHCDLLSYELTLEGARVIVDSGVSDYEPGPQRQYCRGTSGHNTIRIDELEQSEIWGVFRVARRARPRGGAVYFAADGSIEVTGAYDGFRRLFGEPVRHERMIRYDGQGSWRVEDRLAGRSRHSVENFVHIHPDFSTHMVLDGISIETGGGTRVALLRPDPECSVTLSKGYYCPEFGVALSNDLIVMKKNVIFPCNFCYEIKKALN